VVGKVLGVTVLIGIFLLLKLKEQMPADLIQGGEAIAALKSLTLTASMERIG